MCANNDNGNFYDCDCQSGAMATGVSSNGSLMCVGKCMAMIASHKGTHY